MNEQIDKQIDAIRNKYNIDGNSFDIDSFAKELNIIISNAYLPHDDGYFSVYNNEYRIGVDMKKDMPLKRYIIAYALGYYFTKYKGENKFIGKVNLDSESIDFNLDYFARSLLIPTNMFSLDYNKLKLQYSDEDYINKLLSKKYNVPVELIELKKLDLNCLNNNTFIKKTYYK